MSSLQVESSPAGVHLLALVHPLHLPKLGVECALLQRQQLQREAWAELLHVQRVSPLLCCSCNLLTGGHVPGQEACLHCYQYHCCATMAMHMTEYRGHTCCKSPSKTSQNAGPTCKRACTTVGALGAAASSSPVFRFLAAAAAAAFAFLSSFSSNT